MHWFPLGMDMMAQTVKDPPAMQETCVWSLSREDPLEKGMATYSSILAWRNPGTEEPDGLLSMGSQKSQTQVSDFTFISYLNADFQVGWISGSAGPTSSLRHPSRSWEAAMSPLDRPEGSVQPPPAWVTLHGSPDPGDIWVGVSGPKSWQ